MDVFAALLERMKAARAAKLRAMLQGITGAKVVGPPVSSRRAAAAGPAALLDRMRHEQALRQGAPSSRRPSTSAPASSARAMLRTLLEPRTEAARLRANVDAMHLAASLARTPRALSADERRALEAYTGWGGLSIEAAADRFPADFPAPEPRGLVHEYYTPSLVCSEVARVLAPLVGGLAGRDGRVVTLEPSCGIGRFIRAFEAPEFAALDWHAAEYSPLSAAMLRALRPDIDLHEGSFESWVREHEHAFSGHVQLVVSNPPYGKRGPSLTDDPVRAYRGSAYAYAYFLRRALDLLAGGGLGVFLIPSGFLSGTRGQDVALRTEVLRRHHVSVAFRLPSGLFAGTKVVTDLIFFRARGGTLVEVAESDRFILDGDYFREFPANIFGTPEGDDDDDDDMPPRKRQSGWKRYRVIGTFHRLPAVLEERPLCDACELRPTAPPRPKREPVAVPRGPDSDEPEPRLVSASTLGHRVDAFLAAVAAQDNEEPAQVWLELFRSLVDWGRSHGAPSKDVAVVKLATAGDVGAQRFIAAFERGSATPIPALRTRPKWEARYRGRTDDVVAYADFLYRQHRSLHRSELGGADLAPLFQAGWCEDEPGQLVPGDAYYAGELWSKYDRAAARAAKGDRQAAHQAQQLLLKIGPASFDEIDVSPRYGWVPIELVEAWMSVTLNGGQEVKLTQGPVVQLEREGVSVDYDDTAGAVAGKHNKNKGGLMAEVVWCIGWINHDRNLFKPRKMGDENRDDARLRFARVWEESFKGWCAVDAARRRAIERAYQRHMQGYETLTYSQEPFVPARWTKTGPKLHGFQSAGARRVIANRGGLLAFDVGLGKTFTGLAILAQARQEGWAQRPVILVPLSIVWKWVKDIAKVLPDYRVGVIGSKRKLVKGVWTSETDTPQERAATWTRFQGGEYDVVIMSYPALSRTRVDNDFAKEYAEGIASIARQIVLRKRSAMKKADAQRKAGQEEKLTEREEAVLQEGVGAWCAEQMELPEGHQFDPGIAFERIGIDFLMVDEAQNYKNKHLPEQREHGVPRFMGSPGDGAKRAWQLDFRCAVIRKHTGGAGIVLLSATPAKNGPLEFLTILEYIDPDSFARLGISDPEKFIDFFCRLEDRMVINAKLEAVRRSAVVGFKNLPVLASVVNRFGEFLTAEEIGQWVGIREGRATATLAGARSTWPTKARAEEALAALHGARGPTSARAASGPLTMSGRPVLNVEGLGPVRGVKVLERPPLDSGLWGIWAPGMALPDPVVRLIEVDMDPAQERKYAAYVEQIEEMLADKEEGEGEEGEGDKKKGKAKPSGSVLGFLARLAMVSIHANLDEGYIWKEPTTPERQKAAQARAERARAKKAAERAARGADDDDEDDEKEPKKDASTVPSPHSPKFDALADEILRSPTCGHIVFVENTAAHKWVQMVLIERGIPAERIAVLNAIVAEAAADRQRIAEEFNGTPEERDGDGFIITEAKAPRYDVVIANKIAEEGVDLQRRTCAIHHLDLPWEPASLQQRNGRGVRQGARHATIAINYYFARGSMDGLRYDLIRGKRTWMVDLLKGQKRETNNPGAQSDLGSEQILMLVSRDKAKTQKMLDDMKAKLAQEARAQVASEASKSLLGVVQRFARARVLLERAEMMPAAEAGQLREEAARQRFEAEQRLVNLRQVDAEAWPWAAWAEAARNRSMLVPIGGPPVYEGLRVEAPGVRDAARFEYIEFGVASWGRIGVRGLGSVIWREVDGPGILKMELRPEHATQSWPGEGDELAAAMRKFMPKFKQGPMKAWEELGWTRGTDAFAARYWPLFGAEILYTMLQNTKEEPPVPAVVGRRLVIGLSDSYSFTSVLPPTKAGYAEFLRLASQSDLTWAELVKSAQWWWNRHEPGVPMVTDGKLRIGWYTQGANVMPPTPAGFAEFLRLAPESGLKWTELNDAASRWWEHGIPRNLLKAHEAPTTSRRGGQVQTNLLQVGTKAVAAAAPDAPPSTGIGALEAALEAGSARMRKLVPE